MNFNVNYYEYLQKIHVYTALIQRISTIFTEQMLTFRVCIKPHAMPASTFLKFTT